MAIYSRFPVVSLTLPAGGATSANQVLQLAQETSAANSLTAISGQIPASLGIKTSAASMSVTFASDIAALAVTGTFWQATQPISAASLPLPSGAATETTLASVDGKIPASLTVTSTRLLVDGSGVTQPVSGTFYQATQPVSGTFWQATQPVSIASSPLPTDAATETTLSALNTKIPASLTVSSTRLLVDGSGVTQPVSGSFYQATQPVSIATMPTTPVTGTFWQATQPVSGTFYQATQPVSTTQLPSALGQTTMSASLPVVIASNQSTLNVTQGGSAAVTHVRNDYTSTSVTTAAYVQLVASTGSTVNSIEIFDSSGQTLVLATGAAASEVDQIIIFPGGNGKVSLTIAASTRVSVKALSATASVGELDINFYA